MPRKPHLKLLQNELAQLKSARSRRELSIPSEKGFERMLLTRARKLMKKAGLDVGNPAHLTFMCAIVHDTLFLHKRPGRPRKLTDIEAFDLLEEFAFFREKETNCQSKNRGRVTNGLFYFSAKAPEYQSIFRSPANLRSAFERNWRRLEEGEIKPLAWGNLSAGNRSGLNWKRQDRRTELLQDLQARFGSV